MIATAVRDLQCDGVAVLTLISLDMDLMRLNAGVRKLTGYNETLGASADALKYPSPTERKLLVSILIGSRDDRR